MARAAHAIKTVAQECGQLEFEESKHPQRQHDKNAAEGEQGPAVLHPRLQIGAGQGGSDTQRCVGQRHGQHERQR